MANGNGKLPKPANPRVGLPKMPKAPAMPRNMGGGRMMGVPGVLEADRHSYPCPPCRIHSGMTPTGGAGGGLLHERLPTKNGGA